MSMSEEDLRSVIATYQTKSFELFNSNIVYETQIHTLQKRVESLMAENDHLRSHIEALNASSAESKKKTPRGEN